MKRLESWKEIAQHLNRTVRTVQRWEQEQGLPVHRLPHNKLASVFAYVEELDAWWEKRRQSIEHEDAPLANPGIEEKPHEPRPALSRWLKYTAAATLVLAGLSTFVGWTLSRSDSVSPGRGVPDDRAPGENPALSYRRGLFQLAKRNPEGLRSAADEFMHATRIAPDFADAHAGLANAHLLMGIFGVRPAAEAYGDAKLSAEHALALDPNNAEACTALAFVTELHDHDWHRAETLFKRAIAADAMNARAHHWYALLLDSTLRSDDGVREIETALALEPLSVPLNSDLGMVLWHAGRFDRAIGQLQRTITLDPNYADAHSELAAAYLHSGDYARAITTFKRAGELGANPVHLRVQTIMATARAGRTREAREMLAQLESDPALRPRLGPFHRGALRIEFGDYDDGLNEMVRHADTFSANLLVGPGWKAVRNDPRFHEIVRRHGFFDLAERNEIFRDKLRQYLHPNPS